MSQIEFGDPRLPSRFWNKVEPTDNGCWLWTAYIGPGGYGVFNFNGPSRVAHRIAYEVLVGPVPEGMECDHLCRVRHCVNPAHLEAVTSRENTIRGDAGLWRKNICAAMTHCVHGHPFDEENTWIRNWRGHRQCRTCAKKATRDWRDRERAAGRWPPRPRYQGQPT
jgi:hypothetical protein